MFSAVVTSLLLVLGFWLSAVEYPAVQSVMLIGVSLAGTALFCSLEAWTCQERSEGNDSLTLKRARNDRNRGRPAD